jgi:hypothetical protein
MGRFYNNRGMSSLLGNDSVNILLATNRDNNSEYIVITRCYAIALLNKDRRVFSMWSVLGSSQRANRRPGWRSRGNSNCDFTQQKRGCVSCVWSVPKMCNRYCKPLTWTYENIRGLNLAVVKPTTVQVTKLPL